MPSMGTYSNNYPEMTVKEFVKQPQLIERAVDKSVQKWFVGEQLFDKNYSASGGAVSYQEAVSQYTDDHGSEDLAIAEGAEYPLVYQSDKQEIVRTQKFAISGMLTFEAEEHNQLGELRRLTTRMSNTIVEYFDKTAFNLLRTNSRIRDVVAAAAWDVPTTTTIINDIIRAKNQVQDRTDDVVYRANTIVINENLMNLLYLNEQIRQLYDESSQNQRPEFGGEIGSLVGLKIIQSPYVPDDQVFVLEQGRIGGIADEWPWKMKPIERDEARDRYILRGRRRSAIFLTDHNAVTRITGVKTP